MSTTQQASTTNGVRGSKAGKGEKSTRRSWSNKEEASLIAALKDLVADGWKSDNSFRAGYLTRLELDLQKVFPGTDIKGSPHINSKLQNWKKNYYSLREMLRRSGVGWNATGNHTIDCNDDQWDQITKCDLNAKTMRHRSWPMFEDWQHIFGKDRATGDLAEDLLDAVNNMMQEESRAESGKQSHENEVRIDEVSVNDVGEHSNTESEKCKGDTTKVSKGKKRKIDKDGLVAAVEMFCEISRGTNDRLEMVANRVGYQFDLDQAKRDAYALVENIPGLSLDEIFDVCDIFTDQTNRLLVFKGLPADAREKYVKRLLKNKK